MCMCLYGDDEPRVHHSSLVAREPPHCPTQCFRAQHGHFNIPSLGIFHNNVGSCQPVSEGRGRVSLKASVLSTYDGTRDAKNSFFIRSSRFSLILSILQTLPLKCTNKELSRTIRALWKCHKNIRSGFRRQQKEETSISLADIVGAPCS